MFDFFKKEKKKCEHKNIKLISVQPITLLPKRGECKDCGKPMKAKIVWEEV